MWDEASFERLWRRHEEFEFSEPPPDYCPYAEQFAAWVEERLQETLESPTRVKINQEKIHILDRFFEWRSVVPKAHRNRLGGAGHTCLGHVLVEAYERLKVAELSLSPAMLYVPPPLPPPPPPPQIAGIVLGEVEEA